jgi:hypothetical protein
MLKYIKKKAENSMICANKGKCKNKVRKSKNKEYVKK